MARLLEILKGKKTYIVAVIVFVLGGLDALGYTEITATVYALLGALGLASLRDGIANR